MTIDPQNGLLAWRPSIGQVGEHTVVVRATAPDRSIALRDFQLQVTAPNFPPAISSLPYVETD